MQAELASHSNLLDDIGNSIWEDPRVYAGMVVDCHIPASEDVRAICRRILHDHDAYGTQPVDAGYWYDEDYARRVLHFFSYLYHVRGWLKGRRFVWQPWHKCILAEWFGWRKKHRAHGLEVIVPRHQRLFLEVGRKGSKTTGVVGIILHKLLFAKDGAEIYGLATSHKQARYAFLIAQEQINYMANHIKAARYMHYNMSTSKITNWQKQNYYEVLSPKSNANKQTNDSYNPSLILFDEAAQIKDRETFEDMTTGMGARPDGQQIFITTSSEDETTFYAEEKRTLLEQLKDSDFKGIERDLPFFYRLDKDDIGNIDKDKSLWMKPMPHIGHSVPYEYVEKELRISSKLPSRRRVLMTKYFNLPMASKDAWLELSVLHANQVDAKFLRRKGPMICGIDLGIKRDLSAITRMWEYARGKYCWDYIAFLPESRLDALPTAVKNFIEQAAESGYVHLSNTQTIDIPAVVDYLEQTELEFSPDLYCFDSFHMLNVVDQAREREAFSIIFDETEPEYVCKARSVPQNFRSLSGPTKKLEAALVNKEMLHVGSTFIDWQFVSILLSWSATGDLCMLGKDREKAVFIDNFSALTNCIYGNMLFHQMKPEAIVQDHMDEMDDMHAS